MGHAGVLTAENRGVRPRALGDGPQERGPEEQNHRRLGRGCLSRTGGGGARCGGTGGVVGESAYQWPGEQAAQCHEQEAGALAQVVVGRGDAHDQQCRHADHAGDGDRGGLVGVVGGGERRRGCGVDRAEARAEDKVGQDQGHRVGDRRRRQEADARDSQAQTAHPHPPRPRCPLGQQQRDDGGRHQLGRGHEPGAGVRQPETCGEVVDEHGHHVRPAVAEGDSGDERHRHAEGQGGGVSRVHRPLLWEELATATVPWRSAECATSMRASRVAGGAGHCLEGAGHV